MTSRWPLASRNLISSSLSGDEVSCGEAPQGVSDRYYLPDAWTLDGCLKGCTNEAKGWKMEDGGGERREGRMEAVKRCTLGKQIAFLVFATSKLLIFSRSTSICTYSAGPKQSSQNAVGKEKKQGNSIPHFCWQCLNRDMEKTVPETKWKDQGSAADRLWLALNTGPGRAPTVTASFQMEKNKRNIRRAGTFLWELTGLCSDCWHNNKQTFTGLPVHQLPGLWMN